MTAHQHHSSRRGPGPPGPSRLAAAIFAAFLGLAEAASRSDASPQFTAPFVAFDNGATPYSVAITDVNGDGKPDLVLANSDAGPLSVLIGHGDGIFGPKLDVPVQPSAYFVAAGDLNGDFHPDLVSTSSSGFSVVLGNGDGTFSSYIHYPTGVGPRALALADFDGDGHLDVA